MQSDVQSRAIAEQPKEHADPVAHERRMTMAAHVRHKLSFENVWEIERVPGLLKRMVTDVHKDAVIDVYGLRDKRKDQQQLQAQDPSPGRYRKPPHLEAGAERAMVAAAGERKGAPRKIRCRIDISGG